MSDDGLVDLGIVDHDVRITNGTGRDEVDRVTAKVGVGKQLRPIPYGGVLQEELYPQALGVVHCERTMS